MSELQYTARARLTRCFWPPDRFTPWRETHAKGGFPGSLETQRGVQSHLGGARGTELARRTGGTAEEQVA